MVGFRGQKFDFAGEDGAWYALISSLPSTHINMRGTRHHYQHTHIALGRLPRWRETRLQFHTSSTAVLPYPEQLESRPCPSLELKND